MPNQYVPPLSAIKDNNELSSIYTISRVESEQVMILDYELRIMNDTLENNAAV